MIDILSRLETLELEAKSFGFQWETTTQIMQQISSECDEIREHLEATVTNHSSTLQEEIGDLLHAAFSLCVFCHFSPERTLQLAIDKFERRFQAVKQLAEQQGLNSLHGLTFPSLMALWNQAKILANTIQLDKPATEHRFILDERLETSSFTLIDWPLSRVLLKNNSDYPWFILVPRRENVTEITQFSKADREQLMDEVHQLSMLIQDFFEPDKINLGALGNMVSQFHFHVVGRIKQDPLWPQGIWQSGNIDRPYPNPEDLLTQLKTRLMTVYQTTF